MTEISLDQIKKLRAKTSAGVMDCRKALDQTGGDTKKAEELLKQWGIEKSEKKGDRETHAGIIDSYIHSGGKVGVLLELLCETDFVARTNEFRALAHEICLQIASMDPKNVETLAAQPYIRDQKQTMQDLVKETIGKLGENIIIGRFIRYQLG